MLYRFFMKMFRNLFSHANGQKGKYNNELKFWNKYYLEGKYSMKKTNDLFLYFYTTHFGIESSYYTGKRILDIGCGPRGSLEWADMALERIGLDPLAEQYRSLGAESQKMKYITSPSEDIPFEDNYFDVAASFNSLDHVDDLTATISEIKRVLIPGGLFLLLSDVNHDPTLCEPQTFSWEITRSFLPEFEILDEKHYERKVNGMYESIKMNLPYDNFDKTKRYGILSVKFRKINGY